MEDEEVTAKLFREILERRGVETRVVAEGAKAIAAADEFKPDLVLLDIGLADGVDGFAVLKNIRNRKHNARVVIITGRGSPIDIVRGFDLKADNYLVKPISEMEFTARITVELAQIRRQESDEHSRRFEVVYDQVSITLDAKSGRVR
ncbi:MAG: response regulator, partial [Chloroflexota bacterium]